MEDANNLDLRRFYCEQRDKHTDQLMNINGKAAFAAMALLIGLLTGLLQNTCKINLTKGAQAVGACLASAGIIALAIAIAMYSKFHTSRIARFEKLVHNPEPPAHLPASLFCMVPGGRNFGVANYLIFCGISSIFVSIIFFI